MNTETEQAAEPNDVQIDDAAARIDVVNPATGELLARVPAGTSSDVDAAVSAAGKAFGKWGRSSPGERQRVLLEIAARIETYPITRKPITPKFPVPEGHTLEDYFVQQVTARKGAPPAGRVMPEG